MLHLEIVTPEKKIFSDTVEDVYLPGEEGELGILELHAALVSSLKAGELRYLKDGTVNELAIGNGFAEVTQKKVTVLTDMAVGEEEIDEASAEEAMKRAEKALAGLPVGHDPDVVARLEVALKQSIAQLNLKRKKQM
ncbi:MAG: ATP synthase F1 subunit epsilon [Verrucomicrobiae bacterium]|nr:ATP synthase F1 subunit epsilon [Verrucomicrobiae bacterium]NNJ43664.1 ATP synthase F1 subunit epsilon [Akkermansiaceae bacterium]